MTKRADDHMKKVREAIEYNTTESYNEGFDSKKDKIRAKSGGGGGISKGRNSSHGGANKFANKMFTNKNKPNKGGQRS